MDDQLVDEFIEALAAGCGCGGRDSDGVELSSCCFHRISKPADGPANSGPWATVVLRGVRVVSAQSSDRQPRLPTREMHQGCYGESARPPWQSADLLIELRRLGQRLERLIASPHDRLLFRQID